MTRIPSHPALLLLLVMTACAAPHGAVVPLANGVPALRPCPDWSRGSREDFSNRTTSNFGCSDAVNFHAQLADPADAVRGQTGSPGDGTGAATAIARLRVRPPSPWPAGPATAAPGGKTEPGT
jgi:pilus assembly protein CpaD